MAMLNETTVHTAPVMLIWDAASKSDVDQQTGRVSWGVTVAVRKDSAAYAEMKAAADKEIDRVYPTGAPYGFKAWDKDFNPQKYPELNPAEYVFVRFSNSEPKGVYDGPEEVKLAEFGARAYPGAMVSVVGRCWCYLPDVKTKNTTGLKWFYEGVQLTDKTTPRLSVSKGIGANTVASAFGAQPSAQAAFTQPPAAAPVAQAPALPPAAPTPVAPNPGIVPPVPTAKMTAAGQTVESFIAAGWTVEQMRADGWVV